MTRDLGVLQLFLDTVVLLRVLVVETEVLQLRFNLVESQAVGQRSVDIESLASNLVLLVGRLGGQRAHIVKSVADFDEDDADVLAHRQQQLLEVLCLSRCLFTEDAA